MTRDLKTQLQKTSNAIFHGNNFNMQRLQIVGLHAYLESSNVDQLWNYQNETQIPEGICIAPVDAANCMLDFERTITFIRGLFDAIKESQKRNPGKRISVLYAGCGPFATLILPMTTEFSSKEVGFTLVDIHEESINYVKKIIEELGIQDYFDDIVHADATKYKPEKQPDIVLTETMGRALLFEPHLAITENLKKTLGEKGILIPENISLGVKLKSLNSHPRKKINLGNYFELTKDSPEISPPYIIKGAVELGPNVEKNDLFYILLTTKIKVFRTRVLEPESSMITHTEQMNGIFRQTEGTRLYIQYPAGGRPKIIQTEITDSVNEVLDS